MQVCAIREAVPADAQAVFSVHMAAIQELGASHYSDAQLAAWRGDRSAASYANPIASGAILVALGESSIVGFGQLNVAQALVEAVYVHPLHCRRGIGRLLAAALERRAVKAGLVQLALDASLNAEAFYAACGYFAVSRAEHELRPGVFLPCVRMVKSLSPNSDA